MVSMSNSSSAHLSTINSSLKSLGLPELREQGTVLLIDFTNSSMFLCLTFMFSLLNTLALEKIPKGILLMRLCSMLREQIVENWDGPPTGQDWKQFLASVKLVSLTRLDKRPCREKKTTRELRTDLFEYSSIPSRVYLEMLPPKAYPPNTRCNTQIRVRFDKTSISSNLPSQPSPFTLFPPFSLYTDIYTKAKTPPLKAQVQQVFLGKEFCNHTLLPLGHRSPRSAASSMPPSDVLALGMYSQWH